MAEKEKIVSREELVGLVQLVIIFSALLVGRGVGTIYSSYGELSHMSVDLGVSEENMAGYLLDAIEGKVSELNVGMAVTIPGFTSTEGQVTETPDYVRKWLISVTLSPIVVTQPEVSDVEIAMLVEGQQVLSRTFTFPREKVGYITYLRRNITLTVDDAATFKRLVSESATAHGGEVEITLTGRAKANVYFFESMLPFRTTKYPLVLPPSLTLDVSRWETLMPSGNTAQVGQPTPVKIELGNPTRVHSLTQNVTCTIYKEGSLEPVSVATKKTTAAAGTISTYLFSFTPREAGVYYFTLDSPGIHLAAEDSMRLTVNS
jgi:hypothetical protein